MADFNISGFDELIQTHGYDVGWEQALVCNCFENDQPKMNCKYCKGRGFRYLPPKTIKAVTTSLQGDKKTIQIQGIVNNGTAYLTPQRGITMAFNDRVEFKHITSRYSQYLTVGKYETSATDRPIKKVLFVVQDNNLFEEGKDFDIIADRMHLYWTDESTRPKEGTKISILYESHPTYLVRDLIHELRAVQQNKGQQKTVEMPRQYLIKRENFIYGHTVNADKEEFIYNPDNYPGGLIKGEDEGGDYCYD